MTRYTQEAADMIRANYTYDANRGYILSKTKRGGRPVDTIIHPIHDDLEGPSARLNGIKYNVGAVAWLLAYGTWPNHRVETTNGAKNYLKLNTLYESSNPEERGIRNGVHIAEVGPFVAYYHGRRLGDFDTVAEASAAWFEEDAAWIG